jgi:hypothetical protein
MKNNVFAAVCGLLPVVACLAVAVVLFGGYGLILSAVAVAGCLASDPDGANE